MLLIFDFSNVSYDTKLVKTLGWLINEVVFASCNLCIIRELETKEVVFLTTALQLLIKHGDDVNQLMNRHILTSHSMLCLGMDRRSETVS